MATLSGEAWWRANQGKFPNSRDLDELEPGFGANVKRFRQALVSAGASVSISCTRRNATRAAVMHYSWKVAHGDLDPADVPVIPGVSIEWDHGDLQKSRDAAARMVELFQMAHIASLTSNHIAGKAIDWTIAWKGPLVVTEPAPVLWRIESQPRTGDNRELHELGQAIFGVRKLRTDPPHWSADGR